MSELNAYDDLMEYLEEGEEVTGIVFDNWGWASEDEDNRIAFSEPHVGDKEDGKPLFLPFDKRRQVLTLEEAKPYMSGWSFNGGYGSPECYATYIWTNQRVIWVTQYDGSTRLDSAPTSPTPCRPVMPGG